MLDKDALRKIFSENQIEAVIHFAALKAVGESVEMPLGLLPGIMSAGR